MASHLPIPLPPRTPTPPTPIPGGSEEQFGLGLTDDRSLSPGLHSPYNYDTQYAYSPQASPERNGPNTGRTDDSSMLSPPYSATFSTHGGSLNAQRSPITPLTANTDGGFPSTIDTTGTVTNPFNFTTQQYERNGSSIGKAQSSELLGKRRGHKYRHSSIHASHMDSIFKSPQIQRTPLSVPASLPLPTRKEAWWSMTRHQTARLTWCACHFLVSGYIQYTGSGSLAMTALSRLLLFDAAGATVCVLVDVMSNFEVWKRSSIKHPFGLERADVLAGFGMAVFIGFMGLDVISHGVQHALENVGNHTSHHPHAHERVGAGHVDAASLLSIASTLVSAVLLKNHARIGRAMRFEMFRGWGGKILGNPSHFLTLSCSILLLVLPFLSPHFYTFFDRSLAFIIAVLMIALGARLATSLASMLLMSFTPPAGDGASLAGVVQAIAESDPCVSSVEEARFWQVHYGLCMANLKVRYRSGRLGYGISDDVVRIRKRVEGVVRERLGGVVRWDVSVQMSVERD